MSTRNLTYRLAVQAENDTLHIDITGFTMNAHYLGLNLYILS